MPRRQPKPSKDGKPGQQGRSKPERAAKRWALIARQRMPMLWLSAPIGLEAGVRAECAEKLELPHSALVRHQGKVLAPLLDEATGELIVAPSQFAALRTPELMYALAVAAQLDGVEGSASAASAERALAPIPKAQALAVVAAAVAAVPQSVWNRAASLRFAGAGHETGGRCTFYVERHPLHRMENTPTKVC
jgi:hypothetical protein